MKDFKAALKKIDNGRFSKFIEVFNADDHCFDCYHLNPLITDPGKGYRCCCFPGCLGDTCSVAFKSYLFWKLGVITEKQHMVFVNSGSNFKVQVE